MYDSPIIAGATRTYTLAKQFPNSPICEHKMGNATNSTDFAVGYLAYLMYHNKDTIVTPEKIENDKREFKGSVALKGIALVGVVLEEARRLSRLPNFQGTVFSMSGGGGSTDKIHESVFWHLVTKSNEDGTYGQMPSDEAKKQRKEYNQKTGVEYHGLRMTRKREICKIGDTRYPSHWC